jgi:ubiquinone/menaquinone biosynthesis C-methylase UbiE
MSEFMSYHGTEQPEYLRDYLSDAAGNSGIQLVRSTGMSRWGVDPGGRLLDAGSGNGEVARELSRLMPDAEVVAADHSENAIAEAERLHDGSRVKYEVGDVYDLPYAEGHFDGVRTERVLQHLTDPSRAVAELKRVLRPGGRMLLIDTDWDSLFLDGSPENFRDDAVFWMRRLLGTVNQGNPASGRTLRRLMIQAGLRDVHAEPVTMVFTDLAESNKVLPVRHEMVDPVLKSNPEALEVATRWFTKLDQAVADGTFLIGLTLWVATATR